MRIKTLAHSSASFLALALMAQPALAQSPSPTANQPQTPSVTDPVAEDGDVIVVTGIRESLASSQAIKRNSVQVVDSVVAEDIGKLPDLAVSDTAARIPGVQVYRQSGEAARVLVRGLPDFATTYNGREIFTAETRVVALQDFPSANIAALEVFKTSTADLVEPGLAGLVNVRSRRPFDFTDGQIAGTVWGLYTRQADKITPNFNLLATKRFDTGIGEIGVLVNGSYTELQYLDSEPSNTDFIADPTINGQRVRFPDIQRLFYRSGNRARPSANAAVQWKPTPELEIYADFLWQGFRNKIDDRLVAAPLYGGTYSNLVFRQGSNVLESGTVSNYADPLFSFQGGTYNKTNTFQYAGGAKFDSGPLRLSLDIARTDTTFTGSTESVDRIFAGRPTIDFDLTTPQFRINNFDVANPANYFFDGLYEENQQAKGKDTQIRVDGTYEFDDFIIRSVQVGARYTNRDAYREFGNRFAGFRGRNIPITALPLEFQLTPPGFVGTDIQPFRSFLAPTYDSIRNNVVKLRQFVIANGGTNFTEGPVARNRLFNADEETIAGYGQINYALSDLVDGSVGVRVVQNKTRVGGATRTGVSAIDNGQESTDVLPNASIRFRPDPKLQFRASFAQTRTRPNFADLNPAGTLNRPVGGGLIGTDADPYVANGGNPFLRAFKSDNYDLSAEYYFSRTGFASVALFHRALDGFIQQRQLRITDPTLGVIAINGPVNTGKGRITGVEAQFNTFFDFEFLPEWARSFGVQANVTYLEAETQQTDGTPTGLVFDRISFDDGIRNGVSKWNYNLVGLYENGPLSARLTYNGRSRFQAFRQFRGGNLSQLNPGDLYLEEARPADRLDLSLNYSLFENATIFFDWTNITNKPFRMSFSSARDGAVRVEYPRYLRYDESTLSLGVRFRLGK